jgi:flagellar assembly protein FliH
MQKYRDTEIKSFEFSDLKGTHVVAQSQFQSFSFKPIDGEPLNSEKVTDETLRSERNYEKNNNFKIDGIVRDYRGLSRQEQADLEKKIQEEVKRRLDEIYQAAYKEGLEKGAAKGQANAEAKHEAELSQKVDSFVQVIADVQTQTEAIAIKSKQEIYEFVKKFTKWVILKEVNEKMYLENLLEKLLLELNSRKNLILKVGQQNFSEIPAVIKVIEAKMGTLTNLRVESVPEIRYPGIILETENGLIDGSLEGIFQNIDKIFEQVVKHESGS